MNMGGNWAAQHNNKVKAHGIYNTIPFKKVPGRMVVETTALVVF